MIESQRTLIEAWNAYQRALAAFSFDIEREMQEYAQEVSRDFKLNLRNIHTGKTDIETSGAVSTPWLWYDSSVFDIEVSIQGTRLAAVERKIGLGVEGDTVREVMAGIRRALENHIESQRKELAFIPGE